MSIVEGVTPWAGEVVAVPGPHTFVVSVPNWPGFAEPAVVVLVAVDVAGGELLRPHAPAMSTTASSAASEPNRFTMFPP
jgi:hypothetical protein